MKKMTEQEVREHWGETLASLAAEKEVLITSGNRIVARLVSGETDQTLTPLMESQEDRNLTPMLDAKALEQWRRDFAAGRVFNSMAGLTLDRDSRSTR